MSSTINPHHNPTHILPGYRGGHGGPYSKRLESNNSPFSKPVKSGHVEEVRVVDSKSCRQLYLRSAYTFTRQDNEDNNNNNKMDNKRKMKVKEKAKKCLEKAQHRVITLFLCKRSSSKNNGGSSLVIFRAVKEYSCVSLLSIVRRMLACSFEVESAVDPHQSHDHFPSITWKSV